MMMIFLNAEAQTSAFKRIDSLIEIGRYKIALEELKMKHNSFLTCLKKANIYNAIDNHEKASAYYKKALDFKDDYKTRIKLGKSLQKEQNFVRQYWYLKRF